MTASAEAAVRDNRRGRPCDADWREASAGVQVAALPPGQVVVCCSAPLATGGLGRHLQEILDALERGGRSSACICGSTRTSAAADARRSPRHALGIPYLTNVLARLPVPVSPGVRTRAFMSEFDAYAARRLPAAEHLIAFNGQALTQFRAARRSGYQSLELISANSHAHLLARQHARAYERYPLEGSWTRHLLERNLAEYAHADRILVASEYIRESFIESGFREEQLVHFPLTPDPRFERVSAGERVSKGEREHSDGFEIVYVGSLAVHKGVPLLIDAVRRLPQADIKLVLVGSWGTRGMRRFVEGACAADSRISVRPGDPLPHLRSASLCVHPAYEDGFAYAPAEALACGVPVIVSEDTGMKELIDPPNTGLIVPTGDLNALTEAIEAAYRGELFAI
jgi:glycosyltransferase involved in cell wall biosynthesis